MSDGNFSTWIFVLTIQWRSASLGSSPFCSHQLELLRFLSWGTFPATLQLVVVDFSGLQQCSNSQPSRNIGSPGFSVLSQSIGGLTFLWSVQDCLQNVRAPQVEHFLHNTLMWSFIPWKFSKWIGLALSSGRLSKYMASFPEKAAISYLDDASEAALVTNKSYQLVCLCYWTGRDFFFSLQRLYR